MRHCSRCDGFVPVGIDECPNCRSTKKAWWVAPLAFAGASLAGITLSACYGAGCVATIKLPDGRTKRDFDSHRCGEMYDCTRGVDGGAPTMDAEWARRCQ